MTDTYYPTHSPLGASGAHRWMACPASATWTWLYGRRKETPAHQRTTSVYAQQGSRAHAAASELLLLGPKHRHEVVHGFPDLETEDWDAIDTYVAYVRTHFPEYRRGNSYTDGNIEVRFHVPAWNEWFYGTADAVFVDEEAGVIHAVEYKHGAGVVVDVEDNPQLMYYAAGAMAAMAYRHEHDHGDPGDPFDQYAGIIHTVRLHVVQPRAWHVEGAVRTWDIPLTELRAWLYGTLLPAMERVIDAPVTDINSYADGEHCRFCPWLGNACPKMAERISEIQKLMEEDMNSYTPEQIGTVLTIGQTVEMHLRAVREQGTERAGNGEHIPGWALAPKVTHRVWKNKDKAREVLVATYGADVLPETLPTPAAVERLPGGAEITAEFAVKPDASGNRLVPANKSGDVARSNPFAD